MKNDSIDELIDRVQELDTKELEEVFESVYLVSGLSAGRGIRVSFMSWLETNQEKVCSSDIVREYLVGTRYKVKREFLTALAVFLSAWLPLMCAVVGAELLLRIGMRNVCGSYE